MNTATIILSISIILQLMAALLAIRLARITEQKLAWSLITLAVVLMILRRGNTLFAVIGSPDYQAQLGSEWIALSTSLFMLLGMACIAPLFQSFNQSRQVARVNQDKYRTLFEASGDAIFLETLQGQVIECNEAACRMFGYTHEEMTSLTVADLVPPEIAAKLPEIILQEAIYEGIFIQAQGKRKNGQVFDTEVSTRLIHIEGESFAIAYVRDITERKRSETALEQSEEKYRLLVESTHDWVWTINTEGTLTFSNQAVRRILGYEVPEVLGIRILDFLLPEDQEKCRQLMEQAMKTQIGLKDISFRMVQKDGAIRHLECSAQPLLTSSGMLQGFAGIARDVTDRNRHEEAQRAANRLKATATLAGGIAHDFNNLMLAVLGNAEILQLDLADHPDALPLLADITKAARKASDLSQQLLAYARGGKYRPQILNLNDAIRIMLSTPEAQVPSHINVRLELESALSSIQADSNQMNQILLNLTRNAIEAIQDQGEILIRTRNVQLDQEFVATHPGLIPGKYIQLTFQDNGIGMDEHTRSHIFEPFFSTKFLGRGLGLPAIYGIVKNHQGDILVESEPEKGTCVQIFLPAAEPALLPTTPQTPTDMKVELTILVVDDDEMVLDISQRILTRLGYQVLLAPDGQKAVEIVKTRGENIHLVILDLGMPILDGTRAFPLLREAKPDLKVILSSGYELDSAAQALLNAGAIAFLHKPFRTETLVEEIQKALQSN